MKLHYTALVLLLCLLLTGCRNVFDGEYTSVKPHQQQTASSGNQTISASNYVQLYAALVDLIEAGTEEKVISVVPVMKSAHWAYESAAGGFPSVRPPGVAAHEIPPGGGTKAIIPAGEPPRLYPD